MYTVKQYVPVWVGVPVIEPLELSIPNPGGSELAGQQVCVRRIPAEVTPRRLVVRRTYITSRASGWRWPTAD